MKVSPGARKQHLMNNRRRKMQQVSYREPGEVCYSVEDIRNSMPMQAMINPYITRLVRFLKAF